MSVFDATYFDGQSTRGVSVRVTLDPPQRVRIAGGDVDASYPYREVRISARLANTPRFVHLPRGAKCETLDNDAVDAALAGADTHTKSRLLHGLESSYRFVLVALVLGALLIWGFARYGLPYAAERIAAHVPLSIEAALGRQGLAVLDHAMLDETTLSQPDQQRVRSLFERIIVDVDPGYDVRLELRAAPSVGANAFALPSGIVIVTDELVELATSDDELTAVLAHEVGHVQHRHLLRSLLQDSAIAVLIAALLGDLSSVSGLSATLPTFLVQMKYSRMFEFEADTFSADYLRSRGISVSHLATILERISGSLEQMSDEDESALDYLASHPAMRDRIKALHE